MRKQATNEQRQQKHRENTLIGYKDNEKQQTISMGNSNEIRPLPTRNEGAASGEGDPNKLYNKKIYFVPLRFIGKNPFEVKC